MTPSNLLGCDALSFAPLSYKDSRPFFIYRSLQGLSGWMESVGGADVLRSTWRWRRPLARSFKDIHKCLFCIVLAACLASFAQFSFLLTLSDITIMSVSISQNLNMTVKYTECVTLGDHDENIEPQRKNVFDFAGDIECCQESSVLLFFCC